MENDEESYEKVEEYSEREGEWPIGAKVAAGILPVGITAIVGAGEGYDVKNTEQTR